MASSVKEALRPLLVTCSIIGLSIYPLRKPSPHLYVLYSLTVLFVYCCLLYYMFFMIKEYLIHSEVYMVVIQINILTMATSAFLGLYYDKRFRICMEKLTVVDDTLEKLGAPRIYPKLHTWSKRIVIAWIAYICMTNLYDGLMWWYWMDTPWGLLLPYVLNHSLYVNILVDLLFIVLVRYIGTRFDNINEHIQYLLVKEEQGLRCKWQKPVIALHRHTFCADNYKRLLWTSMHLHLELCRIARELNWMFGAQMTLEMTGYLILLTGMCYFSYVMLMMENHEDVPVYAWLGVCHLVSISVARLFTVNYICESVSVKADKIGELIHELTDSLRYAGERTEIYQFALQVMHHPLRFSGMGLFHFGNGFLRKFFMTILTFVVIILQMKNERETFYNPIKKNEESTL